MVDFASGDSLSPRYQGHRRDAERPVHVDLEIAIIKSGDVTVGSQETCHPLSLADMHDDGPADLASARVDSINHPGPGSGLTEDVEVEAIQLRIGVAFVPEAKP